MIEKAIQTVTNRLITEWEEGKRSGVVELHDLIGILQDIAIESVTLDNKLLRQTMYCQHGPDFGLDDKGNCVECGLPDEKDTKSFASGDVVKAKAAPADGDEGCAHCGNTEVPLSTAGYCQLCTMNPEPVEG